MLYSRLLLLATLVGVAAAAPTGAGDRDLPTDLEAVFYLEVDVVELYPVVREKNAYVTGLTAADFLVLDDGREATIDSFSSEEVPLHIILMVDVSESMRGDLRTVQRSAAKLIASLRPDDTLSLHAFNHGPVVAIEATTDHARVLDALADLRAEGSTALFSAVLDVIRDVEPGGERDVLMLFSDGHDISGMSSQRVVARALERGAVIYSFFAPATHLDGRALRDLFVLAERTGGMANHISSSKNLAPVFEQILTGLRVQYSLAFNPTEGPPGKRRIEVKVPGRDVKVRHRRSYHHGD